MEKYTKMIRRKITTMICSSKVEDACRRFRITCGVPCTVYAARAWRRGIISTMLPLWKVLTQQSEQFAKCVYILTYTYSVYAVLRLHDRSWRAPLAVPLNLLECACLWRVERRDCTLVSKFIKRKRSYFYIFDKDCYISIYFSYIINQL